MLLHRARDIHKCLKKIGSFTDDQAKVISWDSDHLEWITIQIFPKSGPYKGGKYNFTIRFDKQYPKQPPQVDCLTPIYHPNIDMTADDYNVCLSLFDEWISSFGLEDVIQGLLFLLYYPNLEDPLSPWFDPSMDADEFAQNLRKSLQGEEIEDAMDFVFPKMIESETEKTPENTESMCTQDMTAQIENNGDTCEVIERENDVKSNSPGFANGGKCAAFENLVHHDSTHSDTHTENAEQKHDDMKPGTGSTSSTDANIDQNETTKATGSACSHVEMVSYLEDNFLTGFSELMAMDLFSDDDDDDSTYMSDDDDDEDSDQELGEGSNSQSEQMSHTIRPFLSLWKERVLCFLHTVIGQHSPDNNRRSDSDDIGMDDCVIETCVDTGHSYWEEIELDTEELNLYLQSRNQTQEKEHFITVCDKRSSAMLQKDVVFLACYCVLSRTIMNYRFFRGTVLGLFVFFRMKMMFNGVES